MAKNINFKVLRYNFIQFWQITSKFRSMVGNHQLSCIVKEITYIFKSGNRW